MHVHHIVMFSCGLHRMYWVFRSPVALIQIEVVSLISNRTQKLDEVLS